MADVGYAGPHGKRVTVQINPSSDLMQSGENGSWQSAGSDPSFELIPATRRAFAKARWIRLEFDLETAAEPREAALYWNDGSGYSEKNAFKFTPEASGNGSLLLPTPPGILSLRFDPLESNEKFILRDIRVYRVSRLHIAMHIAKRYMYRAARNPRFYFDIIADIFSLWRLHGAAGIKDMLRQYLTVHDKTLIRAQLRAYRRKSTAQRSIIAAAQPLTRKLPWTRRDEKVTRIAIGLVEHIGDIVACEPVVRYMRSIRPNAEISWVVNEGFRELIDANPDIDQTIAVDCLTDWIKLVAHNAFDEYVDLHVNGRICQCCALPLRKHKGNIAITGETYFDHGSLLTAFSLGAGLPPLDDAPRIHIPTETAARIHTAGLPRRFVVLHCQTNEDEKNWTPENWGLLADWLRETFDLGVVEVGLQPVASRISRQVIDFCSKSSLLETAEIIRQAALFVGLDSGPAHLANAVGTPGVVLMGHLRNFTQYNPFTGGYADGSNASLIRNLNGATSAISLSLVQETIAQRMSVSLQIGTETAGIHDPCPAANVAAEPRAQATAVDSGPGKPPRLLAFYLPQFHPIPENDTSWGKGFTEWRNVGPSRAYFKGQQQPRVPTELGYYDLRLPMVMEQQAELAQEHGIHGFCYYYYWFEGRRLLHIPIDNMLNRRSPNFPFCFCWANENWTRKWDGAAKEILVAQNHSPEDDRRFIHALIPAFEDKRYIRVDGKPVLLVYRTELFPSPAATAELWRNEVRKAGIGDLYLVRCEGFDPLTTPAEIGFDASYEVPTFYLPDTVRADTTHLQVSPDFGGRIFDYDKIVQLFNERTDVLYKRHRGVMLAWDNTPRYGNKAVVFHNTTEAGYERWLQNAIDYTNRKFSGDDRLVFINAWNEWAEGSYLEPDLHRGRSFLEATRRVVNRVSAPYSLLDAEV